MRVLDEVATAIRIAGGRAPRDMVVMFDLEDQFARPITARTWAAMERHLECALPALTYAHGHWFLPDSLETLWDLVDYVARCHTRWERPVARTAAAWFNARIFAEVRACLANVACLDEKDIVRESRLMRDLGF